MHTTWPSGQVQSMGSHFSLKPRKVKVHSVFRSAVNLSDDDGSLSTLVKHAAQVHPSSALVCFSDPSLAFDELGFTQGQQGVFQEGYLFFNCGIWVSCRGAQRVHPSEEAPAGLVCLDDSFLLSQLKILSRIQQKKQTALTVDALFSPQKTTSTLSSLVSSNAGLLKMSIRRADIELARQGMEALVGLGPGLTPTGDDFLCGYFLAMHMGGPLLFEQGLHSYKISIATILSTLLQKETPLTTDISMQLLGLACEGLFGQPLIAMSKSFSLSVADSTTWEALSGYGHSSGLDAGLGFLFGLSALLPDFEYKGEV